MNLNNEFLYEGLVKQALLYGSGKLMPLMFDWDRSKGVALMNPSIYNDGGQLRAVIRCVNYTMHHSEKGIYPYWAGPLQYVHPETDVRLATENFLVDLDNDLNITKVRFINMALNVESKWEFHGLEDARLFRWDGKLFICGVRRDTTDNGQGRMELSEIRIDNDYLCTEISRTRIPSTGNDDSYCEKNWMPIEGETYKWIKWTNPTEIAVYNPIENITTGYCNEFNRYNTTDEIRGGTHVIDLDDCYVAIGHSVRLWKPYSGEKDSEYTAHLMVWDKNWNLINITPRFKFMNAAIEFSCGMTKGNNNDILISFSETDNECYVLSVNKEWFRTLLFTNQY